MLCVSNFLHLTMNLFFFNLRGNLLCGHTCYITKKTDSENLHLEASVPQVQLSSIKIMLSFYTRKKKTNYIS